jgi:uncharacterized Zn-finger protein
MAVQKKTNQSASVSSYFLVNKSDLPLSCPTPEVAAWSLHPKVYLPIAETGEICCPYCGTRYILSKDTDKDNHKDSYKGHA